MRHLIFIISLFALVVWNLACTKESIENEKKETAKKEVLSIDDMYTPDWGKPIRFSEDFTKIIIE